MSAMSQPYNHNLWLIIALILFSATATADDHLYAIELIAFTHYQVNSDNEHWPALTQPAQPLVGRRLSADPLTATPAAPIASAANSNAIADITIINPATEFTPLPSDQQQLGKLIPQLRRQRLASRILLHIGWVQKIKPADSNEPVLIEGGEPLTSPGKKNWYSRNLLEKQASPADSTLPALAQQWQWPMQHAATRFELEGTVAFYQTRYPRLEINLCLAVASKPAQFPLMITKLNQPTSAYEEVCSHEVRGLKYAEMIYFDTPQFGVLAQVRQIKPIREPGAATTGAD